MSVEAGVVGLGNMGLAIAQRLLETGHDVVGADPSPAARARAEAAGVTIAATPGEVADRARHVVTSLPDGMAVQAVWLGDDGLLGAAPPGATLVEMSTIEVDVMREIAADSRATSVRIVDAPVSGGPDVAREGGLQVLCGGDDDATAAAEQLLGHLGTVLRTGPIGTGKAVKIVNNLMTMGNLVVAAEAFSVGLAAGVDERLLYDVLSRTGGRSHHFVQRFPKAIDGDYSPGFSIDLGVKDLVLGLELAGNVQAPSPVAETARKLYGLAQRQGMGDQDIVAILRLFQDWQHNGRETEA